MSHDSMTRLLAVRHGETAWNRDARIQGTLDIALNDNGLEQARRVGAALQHESLDAVFSSDLRRAHQTASAIGQACGVGVRVDAALRERAFGLFEGLTFPEIEARYPADCLRWRRREPDFGPEGGEKLEAFYARCVAAFEGIASACPGQTIAVVCHGGVLDCLYRAATRIGLQAPRTWSVPNASINRLLYTAEGFTLVGWGDVSHLDEAPLDGALARALDRALDESNDGGRLSG